jgi:hypothetical protein
MKERKGYVKTLFDFSFNYFLASKIIKALYIIYTVIIILASIVMIFFAFSKSVGYGFLMLILSPLFLIILLSLGRIYAEMTIVLFRIVEFTRDISTALVGKEVSPPAEKAAGYKFCTECGTQNEADNEFCKECGARLS